MNPAKFKNRWLVTGTLTTETELHIGDGGALELPDPTRSPHEEETDFSTVCTDHEGKANIPGSAIKGVLRAAVANPAAPVWATLFGSEDPEAKDAVGGSLEFWDARHERGQGADDEKPLGEAWHAENDHKRPWWNPTRRTCVAVSVSLDRRTRTAKENLLYHVEYVPPGETFRFEITGENLELDDVARLVALLHAFNSSPARRTTLGARASHGWGQLRCELTEARCFGEDELQQWKRLQDPPTGHEATHRLGKDRLLEVREAAAKLEDSVRSVDTLDIQVCLTLESPWLVRDPRQSQRTEAAKKLGLSEHAKPPDAAPLHDEAGRPYVPAKSFRGALRARAEMILRTVGLDCADHPGEIDPISTKGIGAERALAKVVETDLAARLFGLAGWRGALEVSRLVAAGKVGEHHQEFVAIDRFTGGPADGAKFDARLAGPTHLEGTLRIDLSRLRKVDPELYSVGLLALVLRDLAEGDIWIGSGSAKGQGRCSATMQVEGRPWSDHPSIVAGLTAFRSSLTTAESAP